MRSLVVFGFLMATLLSVLLYKSYQPQQNVLRPSISSCTCHDTCTMRDGSNKTAAHIPIQQQQQQQEQHAHRTVDVIIRTFGRDLAYHIMLLRTLERFGDYFRQIITIIPEHDLILFRDALAYFGPRFIIKTVSHQHGVWYDMAHTDQYSDAHYMYHLDSDMAIVRPLADIDFFPSINSTRSYILCIPFEHLPRELINGNSWSIEHTLGIKATLVCLGLQFYPREAYAWMRERIMHVHHMTVIEYLASLRGQGIDGYSPFGGLLGELHSSNVTVIEKSLTGGYYEQHDSRSYSGIPPVPWLNYIECMLRRPAQSSGGHVCTPWRTLQQQISARVPDNQST
jgi:hypothetical protein